MLNLSCIFRREANNSRLYLGVDSSNIWIHTVFPLLSKWWSHFFESRTSVSFTLPTWLSEAISDNIPENAAIKKANNILCDSKWRTWRAQGSLTAARTKKDTMISVPSQKLKDLSPENKWWNDREKKERRKADAVRQMSQELQLIFASNRCHFWLVSSFIPSTYLRSLLPSFICNNSSLLKYFSSLTVRIGFLYLLTQVQTAAAASPLVLQGCRWKKKNTPVRFKTSKKHLRGFCVCVFVCVSMYVHACVTRMLTDSAL